MSGLYVASNAKALGSQITLQRNVNSLSDTLTRLSTGLKINSGKDDPAGLIASELLKSDITATKTAIQNTQRANSIIAVADSALGQVSSLLNDIRSLVNQSANTGAMNADQIAANQLQVDASIDSIDRIAKTTNFQGKQLLDGSMDFRTSGTDGGKLSNVQITSANFGTRDAVDVNVKLIEEAKTARLQYNGTGVSQDTIVRIGGSQGSEIFKFGAGASTQDMADLINAASDSTGIVASVEGEASRGTVELNGVGANNSIIITANEEGDKQGDYTFRIVQGETNDAYLVSDPSSSGPGVIEISLEKSHEAVYDQFAGMFDITLNTGSDANASTSVSITRGNTNQATFADADKSATAVSADGKKTLTVTDAGTDGKLSNLNGWTVKVDTITGTDGYSLDLDAKTITITADDAASAQAQFLVAAQAVTGASAAPTAAWTGTLEAGDSFVLGGAADKGELVITYKSGATAGDIQKLINGLSGVQASLSSGVQATDVIADVPQGPTVVSKSGAVESDYMSNVTAKQVADLINGKFGDRFTAAVKTGEDGSGKMTYMDAAVVHGDVNLDNALVFTGMDHGPVVRMSTVDKEGKPIANQALSVELLNPTEQDIANGITTKVLKINLATDASGQSTTTAADIVALFNSLTADKTGGVSASLLLPDGVDPNGRSWTVDNCGNLIESSDCSATYGLGIVQPTSVPGECEVEENDLILLGNNQQIVSSSASARIASSTQPVTVADGVAGASATGTTADGQAISIAIAADDAADPAVGVSLLNGMKLILKSGDDTGYELDSTTGTLTITLAGTLANNAGGINTALLAQMRAAYTDLAAANGSHNAADTDIDAVTMTGANLATDLASAIFGEGGIELDITMGTATGDVFESQGSVTSGQMTITTERPTSALNGVAFNFTTDASQAGFDSENGNLTVYINPATQSLPTGGDLNRELTEAINGAISSNWEAISKYTNTTEGPAKVSVTAGNLTGATVATNFNATNPEQNELLRIPPNDVAGADAADLRGSSVNDPALIIEALEKGTEMAGTKIVLEQDDSITASTTTEAFVNVTYDAENGVLTIKANTKALQSGTQGGVNAQVLADALNANDVFRASFSATAPPNLVTGDDPPTTTKTVAFSSDTTPTATMTGGYEIQSDPNANNSPTGTSNGIAMHGNSDENLALVISAMDSGSGNFVNVNVVSGSFRTFCPKGFEMGYLAGTDAKITVNGQKATTNGNNFTVSSPTFEMSGTLNNTAVGESTSFQVADGGAVFQLGPDVVSAQQIRVGIGSVDSTTLGGVSGKLYQLKSGENADLSTNTKLADRIIQEAISSVAVTRGRLGSVQRSTLEPNQAVLEDTMEQLTAAEAIYSNADFAEESSNLTRAQILVQSSSQALALANQFPQYAAQLVG